MLVAAVVTKAVRQALVTFGQVTNYQWIWDEANLTHDMRYYSHIDTFVDYL